VRDGDEEVVEVAGALESPDDRLQAVGADVHGDEHGVDAEAGEERVEQSGRLDLGHRVAEDGVEPGGSADQDLPRGVRGGRLCGAGAGRPRGARRLSGIGHRRASVLL
jgi:hypothetical protein